MIKKLSILILSMIIIISCADNNPNNPNNNTNKYDNLFLKFETDNKTVPHFTFFKDTGVDMNSNPYKRSWDLLDNTKNQYVYEAPDQESRNQIPSPQTNEGFGLDGLKIYVYRGMNPFKTEVENEIEKQFYFYSYEAQTMNLKNSLVAVDTKTGLVFPYAVPEKWKFVLIAWAPDGWISAELGRTGKPQTTDQEITFEAHKFWQYDPIGQVNEDGTVTLEQFYIDAQGNSDYKPRYTGTSPYKDIQ